MLLVPGDPKNPHPVAQRLELVVSMLTKSGRSKSIQKRKTPKKQRKNVLQKENK